MYKTMYCKTLLSNASDINDYLNEMYDDGWEFVACNNYLYHFKKISK